ncbi:hypothetical protein [Fibrobacter succinogenes]|uniref:hypothetical protein n=1 Tax=Fibrobacter succinogenes TaxID=833 RepID=UPI001569298A|nr:hypothetical protein [Fibrobacter succinogenes]
MKKKICMLMLLCASISFAAIEVGRENRGDDNSGVSVHLLNIHNTGSEIKGFKIQFYYVSRSTQNVWVGSIGAPQGKFTTKRERVSAEVYKIAELDYSSQKIAKGAYFPSSTTGVGIQLAFVGQSDWASIYAEIFDVRIRITSTSGSVLYDEDLGNKSKRVGLLTNETPKEGGNVYTNEVLSIKLDCEDSKNRTRIVSGNKSPIGIALGSKSTFTYRPVFYNEMPKVPYDYVVLKLDNACPKGSQHFTRHHDTEDSNNDNGYKRDIWPNYVGGNADLEYCYVPADPNSTKKYPVDSKYGVFANVNKTNIAYSEIYIDDEDSKNRNSWNWHGASESVQKKIRKIVDGSDNTTYYAIKWTGGTLKKESNAGSAFAPAKEMSFVDNRKFSPEIKGADHSAIAVNLKSTGNVKISVINANGVVVANIVKENLGPGLHHVQWNSGIVPNGRYIVTVKQNGMVGAKNVILK